MFRQPLPSLARIVKASLEVRTSNRIGRGSFPRLFREAGFKNNLPQNEIIENNIGEEDKKEKKPFQKRIMKEKFAFKESQVEEIRTEVQKELDSYSKRYIYLEVLDEKVLDTFLKALLSVNSLDFLNGKERIPEILNKTVERVFTIANFELAMNLFETVLVHRVVLTPENEYQLSAVMISWAPKLDLRKRISIISIIPKEFFLKYKDIFEQYEAFFVDYFTKDLESKTPADYINLMEILKIYRRVGYPDTRFVENCEDLLYDCLESFKHHSLMAFLMYVSRTTDIVYERREKFLKKIDDELLVRVRFLSQEEAVDVLFQLVKNGGGSNLIQRLLFAKINEGIGMLNKDRLLLLVNIIPAVKQGFKEKKAVITSLMNHVMASLGKIDQDYLFETVFMFTENNYGTKAFFEASLFRLTKMVYLLDFAQLSKLCWVNMRVLAMKELHEKILERLKEVDMRESNLVSLNLKDFSYLIWGLASGQDKDSSKFVFDSYEDIIQVRELLSFKDISHILWAVTLKYRIAADTFSKLVKCLHQHLISLYGCSLESLPDKTKELSALVKVFESNVSKSTEAATLMEEMSSWELMNTVWGLSRFNSPTEVSLLIRLMSPLILHKLEECSPAELIMFLRVYCEPDNDCLGKDGGLVFLESLILQLDKLAPMLDIDQLLITMYMLANSKLAGYKDHTELLKRLFELMEDRKKKIVAKGNLIDEAEEETPFSPGIKNRG